MKIGLPSALVNPYYVTFWRTFFEELGLEVVESGKTTKKIINMGIRNSVPEICVPIKIYAGHVLELLEQGVDRIYIPRLVSIRQGDTFCPKFLGLPDMLCHTISSLKEKMITHQIKAKSDNIADNKCYFEIGKQLNATKSQIRNALRLGKEKWDRFRDLCCFEGFNCQMANQAVLDEQKFTIKDHPLKIGVLGYVYNVYDNFISMDILKKLDALGANGITFEMLQNHQIEEYLKRFRKTLFWTFSNRLLAAAYHFFEDRSIDGLIHVTAFGCGPDSFLGKWLELDGDKYDKPFMTIRVDEHTGENHLQTRVEAFVDMITKKKRKRKCVL